MKTRTLRELFQVMLDEFDRMFYSGLCGLNFDLFKDRKFTLDEYRKIRKYLIRHRSRGRGLYWWKAGVVKPRKEWLQTHIELNKKRTRSHATDR